MTVSYPTTAALPVPTSAAAEMVNALIVRAHRGVEVRETYAFDWNWMPDNATIGIHYTVRKPGSVVDNYFIVFDQSAGDYSCSCADHKHYGGNLLCKHLCALVDQQFKAELDANLRREADAMMNEYDRLYEASQYGDHYMVGAV